jgi:ATP-dependent RNA helicase RhlE
LGIAQTGTGKTAAFALPLLQLLAASHGRPAPKAPRALVLSPTRELAAQIHDSFVAYGKHLSLRHTVIFGGVGQAPQVTALARGVDVLVATPGRLHDLIQQRHVTLRDVVFFVLDEADRMLDMGFIHDVKRVIRELPQQRQSLLFSATMPGEIAQLARSILHHPLRIEVAPPATTVEMVTQKVHFVEKADKPALLAQLLDDIAIDRALVFTRTKHGADKVARHLRKQNFQVEAIHGDKSQSARVKALDGFRDGSVRVLVATDIAARGIDVPGITHVFNFDVPNVPDNYVHRIGRTARAGAKGVAISLCTTEEREFLRDIEKTIKRKVEVAGKFTSTAKEGSAGKDAAPATPAHRAPAAPAHRAPHAPLHKPGTPRPGAHAPQQPRHAHGGPQPRRRRGPRGRHGGQRGRTQPGW